MIIEKLSKEFLRYYAEKQLKLVVKIEPQFIPADDITS
jgi:hypothetical protein